MAEELIHKIESLAVQPEKHRLAPESPRFTKDIRQLLFRKRRSQFRVLYTIERQTRGDPFLPSSQPPAAFWRRILMARVDHTAS